MHSRTTADTQLRCVALTFFLALAIGFPSPDDPLPVEYPMFEIDSDGDGVWDLDEIANGTSPTNYDTDGDGLSDLWEGIWGYGTDPLNPDTDGDFFIDSYEFSLGTNALNPDTDGDALWDGVEIMMGLSPMNPDTDGDGVWDGDEATNGTNPMDPHDPTDLAAAAADLAPVDSPEMIPTPADPDPALALADLEPTQVAPADIATPPADALVDDYTTPDLAPAPAEPIIEPFYYFADMP